MERSDRIYIRDLLVRSIIGINTEERANRQDTIINITLFTDTRAAGASDAIEDAVDYRSVTKRVIHHAENSQYGLVEALAESLAQLVLREFPVHRVRVRVEKPGALRFARTVGIEIERERA